ncbi:MAG: protein kinase [Elusimicrobia bacterium]|nr:protein kinase [Elusimicrobiota bacterium]
MPSRILGRLFLPFALCAVLSGTAAPENGTSRQVDGMLVKPETPVQEKRSKTPDPADAKKQISDYMGSRNPAKLDALVPALIEWASTPEGQKMISSVLNGMAKEWAKSGRDGSPNEFFAREMINRSPEGDAGYRLLAEALANRGDPEGTIEAASKAMEYGGPDHKLYVLRGVASSKLGDYQAAHGDAADALRLNPSDAAAMSLFKLSESRLLQVPAQSAGGSGEEGAGGRGAPAPQGGNPAAQSAALTSEAAAALKLGDAWAAIAKAGAAISLNPNNAQAYNLRATAETKLSKNIAAVEDATKALELAPGGPAALTTRAWALGRLGSFSKALSDATLAAQGSPADGAAHFTRAFALSGLGRRGEMLDELKAAAELQPAFQGVYAAAVQLPASADSMLLFSGMEPARAAALQRPIEPRRRSSLTIILATLIGGFLIALGLLQNAAGLRSWTQRMLKRASPAAAPEAGGAGAFWRRFAQVREIGEGGMGVVYEAVDVGLKRKVAVKKMREGIRSSERERARFLEEARIVASLKHPGIVEIHSIEEEGLDVYLVFEFVEGSTLEQLVRERGTLKFAEARRIFQGVCEALDAAHERGVIHRDLKPANILITPQGLPKVMDFGLARSMEAAVRMTTNTIWGSPSYMAPEQEEGEACVQSDIYSLGICLYEALSGQLPFTGSPAKAFLNKKEGRFTAPSRALAGLPPDLDRLIGKALEPMPERRFPSARAFSEALDQLVPS